VPGGIFIIFGDYKRLPDLMYAATTVAMVTCDEIVKDKRHSRPRCHHSLAWMR